MKTFDGLTFIIVSVLIMLGSFGIFREIVLFSGIIIGTILLGIKILIEGKVKIQNSFWIYLVFILVAGIHTLTTKGDFYYFYIYFSGIVFILLASNFNEVFRNFFSYLLVALGLLMGGMYFVSQFVAFDLPSLSTLFAPPTDVIKHSNVGDLWAIIVVATIFGYRHGLNLTKLVITVVGIFFIGISFSRSAVLSVATSILYLFYMSKTKTLNKYFPYILISLSLFFLIFGSFKSILFSRPYFLESIVGLFKYPLGTGIGRFALVSNSTNFAHNILLEMISAMGIFSLPFIAWVVVVYKNLISVDQNKIFIKSVQLSILFILMFTPNYIVVGFMWLWFISIGLEEKEDYSPR